MNFPIVVLGFLFLFAQGFATNYLDLEDLSQDFVLESKKIEIPGYAFACNPSIIRWQGRLLMSFRIVPDRTKKYEIEIGLVFLDENFEPSNIPQIVSLRDEYAEAPSRAEDARLIVINNRLLMVYDDNVERKISKGGFRVYIAEIIYDGEHFIAENVECLNQFEGESREVREKSWVPFVYQGSLLLAYSLSPHRIFYPRLDGSGICDTVTHSQSDIRWKWGVLRGGTPGLIDNEQYLAFFHSSIEMASANSDGVRMPHYFIGAYTFSNSPPFAITSVSPAPIIGKNFYNGIAYKPYYKPIRCVFPCGYIADEEFIWIAYGRDDHECWLVKLDKQGLLQSLIPVCDNAQ